MITIGYLDEATGPRFTFNRVFKTDFDVKILDNPELIQTTDDLLTQIEELELDVLAVDYKLADGGWLSYNGDEVVNAIWKKKRYFPVFMLTSYPSDAMSKMENVFLVKDKSIISESSSDSGELQHESVTFLKEQIKKSVENYKIIVSDRERQTKELEHKQETHGLSKEEENRLLALHIELHAIDPESNPIAPANLQTSSIADLREIVDSSRKILQQLTIK